MDLGTDGPTTVVRATLDAVGTVVDGNGFAHKATGEERSND